MVREMHNNGADHVFDVDASNSTVYETAAKPLILASMEGFNGLWYMCVFEGGVAVLAFAVFLYFVRVPMCVVCVSVLGGDERCVGWVHSNTVCEWCHLSWQDVYHVGE